MWRVVDEANRYVERVRPWELARTDPAGLDAALAELVHTCHGLAAELAPFLPAGAARITRQITPVGGRLPPPQPLFRRYG